MPILDTRQTPGRLNFKFVYYGPSQSGKTTNLMSLHDILCPEFKGEMMTMETEGDRTLYFDLMPLGFRAPSGLLISFRLFTVPGQVQHDVTRKTVLSRADGIVFVADSQRSQSINNGESFQNLAENAARLGMAIEQAPLVVQFNKRDLDNVLSEEEIFGRWGNAPWPVMLAVATDGTGVVQTFSELLRRVHRQFDAEYELSGRHGLTEARFVDSATRASQ